MSVRSLKIIGTTIILCLLIGCWGKSGGASVASLEAIVANVKKDVAAETVVDLGNHEGWFKRTIDVTNFEHDVTSRYTASVTFLYSVSQTEDCKTKAAAEQGKLQAPMGPHKCRAEFAYQDGKWVPRSLEDHRKDRWESYADKPPLAPLRVVWKSFERAARQ